MPPEGRAGRTTIGIAEQLRRELRLSAGGAELAAGVHQRLGVAGTGELLNVLAAVQADIVGAGPLEPLLADDDVTDVLVNGPGPVWVDRGRGLERSDVRIDDEVALRQLAQRLVTAAGRRLDDASPFADARIATGVRVHAVLPPVAPQGTTLSLRLAPRRTFTMTQLVERATVTEEGADLLTRLVRSRMSFLVTGGTGTGKTTILSTLLSQVSPSERLVLIEDAPELRPSVPHVVRLQTRLPNLEGAGEIDLHALVRQALRMRPDRIVVGEVRGREVVELLAALNTGHEGGCGTVHANSAQSVPARIEALCTAAGLGRAAAHAQLAAALSVVIELHRGADGIRRVKGISVLQAQPDGLVVAVPAVALTAQGLRSGPGESRLQALLDRRCG